MKYSIAEAFQDLEMIKTESPIYEESETKDITFKFPEGSLNIGQKIKYGTKVYTIIDLEWNDKYGYDIEIDKIDSRGDLGVWIGNGNHNVEVVDDKIEESVEDNKLHEDKFSLTNKVETEEAKEVEKELNGPILINYVPDKIYDKLIEKGLINNIADIYKLTLEDIASLKKNGKKFVGVILLMVDIKLNGLKELMNRLRNIIILL